MKDREKLDLSVEELAQVLARVQGAVDPSDYEILQAMFRTFLELVQALEAKKVSIGKLRDLIFGSKTEKTRDAGGKNDSSDGKTGRKKKKKKKKRKGHGRNGVDAYPGAERIPVPHETIKVGQSCPHCTKGKVYRLAESGKELRIVGQPALKASIYEPERLRCNLCGEVFTAKLPKKAGIKKYDATAGSIIAALKYGSGFPFYRLDRFQEALGVPLPASVQWEIVDDMAQKLLPAFQTLSHEAAQGKVIHNDDTTAKILGLGGDAEEEKNADTAGKDKKGQKRTGTFTSAIVSIGSGKQIALFFTGRQHAGENLKDVLSQRAGDLPPPIQMCDALERNLPGELKTIVGNCLAHGRRKFFEVATCFPEECRHVLDELAEIYRIDALAKEKMLTDEDRLELHKENSAPVMKRLHSWLKAQISEKKVEPNSGLGKAIDYLLKRWKRFTLFLRQPGAPLDNNIAERVLKMAILHRKNAYFYKTERGAAVGDLFMSLIQTCRLNKVNPFKYLTALQENADRLREKPADWLPWNYEAALPKPAVPDPG